MGGGYLARRVIPKLEQEENLELAIYVKDENTNIIPVKGNQDGYVFDKATCFVNGKEDASVTVSWDSEAWAPVVKGLTTYKTRCDLYFKEETDLDRCYEQYGEDSINCSIIAQLDDTGKCPTVAEDGTVQVTNIEITNGYLCSAPDDYGTSYYFRGTSQNNYVYFAGYYWRILRINGDGSIRMIYDGTTAHPNGEESTDRAIGTSAFNAYSNDNAYLGYMYGATNSTSYEATHANTNSSAIKSYLDTWYENNLLDQYAEYINDTLFCNDRSIAETAPNSNFNQLGYARNGTAYRWYYGPWDNSSYNPKLTCELQNDRFTVNDEIIGNGDLTYPIALVSVDEVVLAGGYNTSNTGYYLYMRNSFWTMTPFNYLGVHAANYSIGVYGDVSTPTPSYDVSYSHFYVRPVINLKPNSLKSGDGTASNPYQV